MAGGMDLVVLRQLVQDVLDDFARMGEASRTMAPSASAWACRSPPCRANARGASASAVSLAALADADLPSGCGADRHGHHAAVGRPCARFAIEDVLWAGRATRRYRKWTRCKIARELDLDAVTRNADRFAALLDSLWGPDDDPLGFLDTTILHEPARAGPPARIPQSWRLVGRGPVRGVGAFERVTPGSGGSWKGSFPPTSSPMSRCSDASSPSSTTACARPAPSSVRRERPRLPSIQRRPGRHGATGGRRT